MVVLLGVLLVFKLSVVNLHVPEKVVLLKKMHLDANLIQKNYVLVAKQYPQQNFVHRIV